MTPWGFIVTEKGLTATTSHKERMDRARLGETAIAILEALRMPLARVAAVADRLDAGEGIVDALRNTTSTEGTADGVEKG